MTGVLMGAWASVGDRCTIEYDVCGDVAEFTLGGRRDGFELAVTEHGLENLVAKGAEALDRMRARRDELTDESDLATESETAE